MTTLGNQCYTEIEHKILSGEYAAGEKLGMHRLRGDLRVGLSPIREALSRLVNTGLVEVKDNKGFNVTRITQQDVRDLYHTYASIESLALQQAIAEGDANWEANIAAKQHLLSLKENSPEPIPWEDWYLYNEDFHKALVEGCNSPSLMAIRDYLVLRLSRYWRYSFNLVGRLEKAHDEHMELAKATLARDSKRACRAMKKHILGSLEELLNILPLPQK